MAFYIVTDGRKNGYGDADSFVIRASGVRQAVKLAPLVDAKGATVEKLEDGRDVPNGVVHASFAEEAYPTPTTDYNSALVEAEDETNPYASYSF